jgi:ubiquinone/menaquinone biosynthesis C-methylase UbiE
MHALERLCEQSSPGLRSRPGRYGTSGESRRNTDRVSSGPEFRSDLYRGTARFYDEFRVAYPQQLLDDLRVRARITGAGRLLDLACGTGQITFGLGSSFDEVWAVDQEPEAVEFARAKALRHGMDNVRWIAERAEDVDADGYFELVAIGNAFHRLERRVIAESAMRWLVAGGHLALLWCNSPWDGSLMWQRVMADTLDRWTRKAAATERVPANLNERLAEEPHTNVLASAGFTVVGAFEFEIPYEWSVEKLTGFMYSTSVLSQPALGRNVEAFEKDLRERLLAVEPEGVFREDISFSYTLARRP